MPAKTTSSKASAKSKALKRAATSPVTAAPEVVAAAPAPEPPKTPTKTFDESKHHEGFKGLAVENWTAVERYEQILEEKVGAWISYTRDTYVPRAEFLKRVKENEEKGLGPVKKQRKKIMCVIKELDAIEGTLKVESIPRSFKDDKREQRVMSWTLREGMKGMPKFYVQAVKQINV